ncbi:MAG: PEP/pyruvate-binding domain-containing protein [Chloroflexi bacterium]|nr:PEP/pyruvate-binding domain-containing protein [Chloroflexota bacterium]
MTLINPLSDRVLNIYLALTQYPILAARIREKMRTALFSRGIILADSFEAEVWKKSVESQVREGLHDPFGEESYDVWELRRERMRDALTDFYFSYNLPYEEFEYIVRQTVGERGEIPNMVTFNPELAPQEMLFEQAEMIERLPGEKRKHLDARLQEIKVVLIRTMISDQLSYLKIARRWFTVSDLKEIRQHKIGYGKIGGKSAGMMLAYRILSEEAPAQVKACFRLPESYFLASDIFYTFMSANGLVHWADQKYKPEAQIRAEYPIIVEEFTQGKFPRDILDRLRAIVDEFKGQPFICRSSSLLEDNLGTSFAGKYDSFFCPNQGTPEENLDAITNAIARIYASALNPNALIYRHHKGLEDYDERVAVLIQPVQGEKHGHYFLPHGAGVAFSRNLYRWSPQIKRDAGFLRLVWGLGTRAVDNIGNDHPRLVALSHPLLHPAASTKLIKRYSQQFVDLIDLDKNELVSLPVEQVLNPRYPALRYIAQVDEGDYLTAIRTSTADINQMVVTFDELLRRTPFAKLMREALSVLENEYGAPVDTEFTVEVTNPQSVQPGVMITLLQCRPQSHIDDEETLGIPADLSDERIIFSSRRMVPHGAVKSIRYILFVTPEGYFSLPSQADRTKLERTIGQLNTSLKEQDFICIGPGRWGTSTPDLGVHVTYADIYNTRALIELSGQAVGTSPEPSFGTHFFQDMMEAHIYPLAINLDDRDVVFRHDFFYSTPNHLSEWSANPDQNLLDTLRLVDVQDFAPGQHLVLVMDDDEGRAVGFLEKNAEE